MKKQIIDLLLYRWRYILGYGALALLFAISVTTAALYAPGGISQSEIDSIATTNLLASGDWSIPNLPLHLLQLASFSLFGVSIFSIKLPSLIMSMIAAAAMFFLLRRWFKSSIAVLSMLIMTVTGQFIFVAQSATPHITYVAFTALILLFASLVFQKAKHPLLWKISLAATIGLSFYTPYFIYINAGLLLAALIHPHTRYNLFKKSERPSWLIAAGTVLLITAPLIYLCSTSPELINILLGQLSSEINLIANLKLLAQTYFWISPIVSSGQILPIMDFSTLALIILGILALFRQRHTARSYMIVTWMVLAIPLLIIRPNMTIIITIPLFILLAIGVETLLGEWYKLFPKNPYARGTGLVFIIALISVMIFSGFDRFTGGYRQMPEAAREFSKDISLVKEQLAKRPVRTAIVVGEKELPLYEALARHSRVELITTTGTDVSVGNILVTREAKDLVPEDKWTKQGIITNDWSEKANRLYLYKSTQNRL